MGPENLESETEELPMSVARASDELLKLRGRRPDDNAPVYMWRSWLEQQADLWDMIVAADGWFADNARYVADHLRRMIKDLHENYRAGIAGLGRGHGDQGTG